MLEPFVNVVNEFIGNLTTDNLLTIGCCLLFGIFLVLIFKR